MIDLLLAKPVGIIVACNILASLDEGLLSCTKVEEFLTKCLEAFKEDKVPTTEELIVQFEDVARGERPFSGSGGSMFVLACTKRTTSIKDDREFSTITEVGTFKEHLVLDSALADGHASFLSNPDPTDPALKDAIDKLNGRTDFYRPGARLGGNPARPLFWIVPTDRLSEERTKTRAEDLGDAFRDLLGLIHYEDKVPLVEICIPGDRMRSHKHARPTFADAGTNVRFRPYKDAKHPKRSGWGCTVHLLRFVNGDKIIDGVPERVVEPIAFNSHLGVRFEFVGFTKTVRGNSAKDNHTAFYKRLHHGTKLSILRSTLLDILS